jgi:uncharacterized protein YqhQ
MSRSPGATVGGQAVLEGVMMRAPDGWAVAVRKPDGDIETVANELPRLSARSRWARLPFFRGIMVLVESLSLGFRALAWSAQKAGEEEEEELTKRQIAWAMVLALVFFAAIFMAFPVLLTRLLERFIGEGALVFNLVDGLIRMAMFLGYVWLIGLSSDIRRVFQYHGAEHKTIHAYEAGDPLVIDEIQKYSPRHPRCGTSFLMIVFIVAVMVFTILGKPAFIWLVAERIFLIPVIAGVSYEVLKAAAGTRWMAWATKPGMWLQSLTTREPEGDMVEVAIASLLSALTPEQVDEVRARGEINPAAYAAVFG